MITIKKIIETNFCEPERQLTPEEKLTVIASWGDDNNYWYFTNEDLNSNEWALYQQYINQPPQITEGSVAFEAFKQCTDEEKRIMAQSLKEYL